MQYQAHPYLVEPCIIYQQERLLKLRHVERGWAPANPYSGRLRWAAGSAIIRLGEALRGHRVAPAPDGRRAVALKVVS